MKTAQTLRPYQEEVNCGVNCIRCLKLDTIQKRLKLHALWGGESEIWSEIKFASGKTAMQSLNTGLVSMEIFLLPLQVITNIIPDSC